MRRFRVERRRLVLGLPLVRAHVHGLLRPGVPHVDVGVVGRLRPRQRHPLAVVRHGGGDVARRVPEEQRPGVGGRVAAVDVEEPRVALVRDDVERMAVGCPAQEIRLQLRPGREVLLGAIGANHVEMVQLVAALVSSDQDAIVVRKERDRSHRVGGGLRHGRSVSAGDWNGIGVVDPGAVRREENPGLVGRERSPAHRLVVHELFNRVLLLRALFRRRPGLPGRRCAARTGCRQETGEHAGSFRHAVSLHSGTSCASSFP